MIKLTDKRIAEMQHNFVADEDTWRDVFKRPFTDAEYTYASDTTIILRIAKKYFKNAPEISLKLPQLDGVIPEHNPTMTITREQIRKTLVLHSIDAYCLGVDCPECNGRGSVSWSYTDRNGATYNMMDDCPVCDGGCEVRNGKGTWCRMFGRYINVHNLILMHYVMNEWEIDEASVSCNDKCYIFNLADGIDIIAVTLQNKPQDVGIIEFKE